MNTYEKEKLEGYAKIITNFSNDTDTDQILTNYFNNIRATFNFSDVFIKQTQRIFPTQERFFGSFNNGEIELLRKIGERDEICHAINRSLYDSNELHFIKYNTGEQTFVFSSTLSVVDCIIKEYLVPVDEVEEFIDGFQLDSNSDFDCREDRLTNLENLIQLEKSTEKIKGELKIENLAIIESKAKEYRYVIRPLHDYVKECQNALKKIMLQMTEQTTSFYPEFPRKCNEK